MKTIIKETKRAIEREPESAETYSKKLKEFERIAAKISAGMDDLEDLKKSIHDKILKKTESVKEVALKTIKFYEDTDMKARHAVEKSVMKLIIKDEAVASSTDLCFMIDCTGSMSCYIAQARDTVNAVIDSVKETYPHSKVRIAIVGYRDIEDGPKRFEIMDFCESVLDVKNFLNSLAAMGGGDGPEDVNGAFQKTHSLGWENSARNIIHIADAPCHGAHMNGYTGGDNHPEGYTEGDMAWNKIMENLKKSAIGYLLCAVGSEPKFMFSKFQEIYKSIPNTQAMDLLFEMKDLGLDKEMFVKMTASHVKSSIASSLKTTYAKIMHSSKYPTKDLSALFTIGEEDEKGGEKGSMFKKTALDLSKEVIFTEAQWDQPDFWNYNVQGSTNYIFGSGTVEDLMKNKFNNNKEKISLKIRKTPFGKGSFCLAYHCRAKPSYCDVYFNMVLKKTIEPNKRAFYFSTLYKNTLAITLVKEYNKALQKKGYSKNINLEFTRVLVVQIGTEYYLLEAYIPGKFEKYTNNFNYVNESVPFMTAFSHFSYEFTKGKYMVTDLQGSNNLLTDPAVHSSDVQFASQGDFGLKGMVAFFRNHECNEFCKKLGLKPHAAQAERSGAVMKEKVAFDISNHYKKCHFYYCNGNAKDESLCTHCKVKVDITKLF